MLDFLTLQTTSTNPTFVTVCYSVLLSFLMSCLIAFTYEKTYRGLSYSRNYVQALILCSIVAATVMQAIGDSLARGLGMMGAMAIIRFRTNFKDARDIIFMFAALASGIAAGVYGFAISVTGTVGFCVAAFVLYYSPFGQRSFFDGMLRFSIEADSPDRGEMDKILDGFCKTFALITLRDAGQGKRVEYSYHVKLRKNKTKDGLVEALRGLSTVKGVNLMLQETTIEL